MSADPPVLGPPKPEAPKKHKASKKEVRLRREKVAYMLGVQRLRPDDILKQLHGTFAHVTLDIVYDDIEHIKHHSRDYIALEYLPEFSWTFESAVKTLEEVQREAMRRYRDGETETHMTQGEKGTVSKIIHREGSSEWLSLVAKAAIAQINLGKTGPVTLTVQQILQENERLKKELAERQMPIARPQS